MFVYVIAALAALVPLYAWRAWARTPRRRSNVRESVRPYVHVYPPFEEDDPR